MKKSKKATSPKKRIARWNPAHRRLLDLVAGWQWWAEQNWKNRCLPRREARREADRLADLYQIAGNLKVDEEGFATIEEFVRERLLPLLRKGPRR